MANAPGRQIWRYMDLAKFLSLLTTRSLYFACPSELGDHMRAFYRNVKPKCGQRSYSL